MGLIFSLPHIVLKAFATEAYLKALIMVEGKAPPKIHNLLLLFDELDLESKKLIQRWWNKKCAPELAKARKHQDDIVKVPKTMRGALSQAADAFVEWRYVGSGSYIGFMILGFPLLVRRRILEKMPEWRPELPNPLAVLNSES